MRKLQLGTGRFKGKLPFKCFECGKVGHYAAKCPYKRKEVVRRNKNRSSSKKSYYANEDSDESCNSEEECEEDLRLLMAFEQKEEKDMFMDALEENDFLEENNQLKLRLEDCKILLEEQKVIRETVEKQLEEAKKHIEKLECEVVIQRKEVEKEKTLNLRFAKGSETLDEIIKVQRSPLIKTGLGYTRESSQASAPNYLKATTTGLLHSTTQQGNKESLQVKHDHLNSRNTNRSYNQQVNSNRRFHDHRNFYFNGQCFSCHNFGHKVVQCVAYKTTMTREAREKRMNIEPKKNTYNNFSPLQNEVECTYCNNFGHEESECRSKVQPKEHVPSSSVG